MKILLMNIDSVKSQFEKTAILAKNKTKGIIDLLYAENINVEFI